MTSGRSIFEDVSENHAFASPKGPKQDPRNNRGAVVKWLFILFALVVLMVAVGGLTRLTDSGLSITEWRPVTGAFPPTSEADWTSEFEKYQASPEYQIQNQGMQLSDFKRIYWWEWGHRQLGRVIGLVWAAGFLFFLLTRRIPRGWTGRLLLLGGLGGLQGAVGWWMVASGLVGARTDVASYRLATHLGLAFIILGLISWYILRLRRTEAELLQARRRSDRRLSNSGLLLLAVCFVQILLGALVAGIDAGRSFTDWPLMGGRFFPATAWDLEPIWRNLFENSGLVQFMHRMWGYLFLVLAVLVWRVSRRSGQTAIRKAYGAILHGLAFQVLFGIATVLMAAPWYLGLLHQLVGVAVFVTIIRARFVASYPPDQKIARS
ncbi:heme A synthase [Algicella marina]|uniref:Heme A synthase n=1 Tax=Algicella marina TaxID=2683284 RepID=A0A6P1SZB4_9RHOB|nr:heme A synthase [Algicella marina]QHQ34865.1 heme A synthase [Algicella marina]